MEISERWIIGTLLTVGLLTFFFPLATFQIPILGNQEVSGYDLISRAKELNQTLDAAKRKEWLVTQENRAQSPETIAGGTVEIMLSLLAREELGLGSAR